MRFLHLLPEQSNLPSRECIERNFLPFLLPAAILQWTNNSAASVIFYSAQMPFFLHSVHLAKRPMYDNHGKCIQALPSRFSSYLPLFLFRVAMKIRFQEPLREWPNLFSGTSAKGRKMY